MSGQFQIAFISSEALKEYRKLDGSTKRLVNVAISRLKTRADEVGEPLKGSLSGCKKLKWRSAGLRMVFRILADGTVEVVEIVAIGRRDKDAVYKEAEHRIERRGKEE